MLRRACLLFALLFIPLLLSLSAAPPARVLAAPPPAAQGDPYPHMEGDGYWDSRFHVPNGVNGEVRAIATSPAGHLAVGGEFTYAEDVLANSLALWDGSAWHTFGEGDENGVTLDPTYASNPATINAIAYDSTGRLYVGGFFDYAGTVPAKNIAMWDGSNWHALDVGSEGVIGHIVIKPDDTVVVSGDFYSIGGTPARIIAQWDGEGWHSLGNDSANTCCVSALLAAPNGDIYVGGSIDRIGGYIVRNLGRWDGAAWHRVGEGTSSIVNALAWGSDHRLYVGGVFSEVGTNVPARSVARWDGVNWEALDLPESLPVRGLAITPNGTLFANIWRSLPPGYAQDELWRWNGDGWYLLDVQGAPYSSFEPHTAIRTLYVDPGGDLLVGHTNSYLGGASAYRLGRWEDTTQTWHGVGTGAGVGSYGIRAFASTDDGRMYAGGYSGAAGQTRINGVAEWRDGAWHPLGRGLQIEHYPGAAREMAADGNDLYVAGAFDKAGDVVAKNVARWDGNAWHALGNGLPGVTRSSAIAVHEGRLAVSEFYLNRIVHYFDGTAWSQLPQVPLFEIHALAWTPDGTLYAGGKGANVEALARYANGSWQAIAIPLPEADTPIIHSLAAGADGSLYVGAGYVSPMLRYDGTAWQPLEGLTGTYRDLNMGNDGILYATGELTHDGATAHAVAGWDGEAWHTYGAEAVQRRGWEHTVYYSARDGGLWLAGDIVTAGGHPSANIARYALSGLGGFDATRNAPTITLSWSTLNESIITGFSLYRAATPDGTPELLNPAPIPAQHPGTTQGVAYTFVDSDLAIGESGYYWIEVIKSGGEISRYGYVVGAAALPPTPTPTASATATPSPTPAQRSLYLPLIRRATQS